jgi:hypothetical protein
MDQPSARLMLSPLFMPNIPPRPDIANCRDTEFTIC